jgi:hypothetical protein
VWIVAGAIVIAALMFPFQYEVTPAWWFDVAGPDNNVVVNCAIAQHWEWLAAGVEGDDTVASDSAGHVHFPARRARVSLARQWLGAVRGFGFHSAFMGPRAYFQGCGQGNNRERLDVEKVGANMTYRYVPGSQAPIKPLSGRQK